MSWKPWQLPDRDINGRIIRAKELRAQAELLLKRLENAICKAEGALGGDNDDLRGR